MIKLLIGLCIIATLAGCQQVYEVEYYEPTEVNKEYCIKSSEKSPGLGPIKKINGKSGALDFSDNKSFSFRASVF